MALDPRIPLSVETPQVSRASNPLKDALDIQEARQKAQANAIALKEKQDQAALSQWLDSAYQNYVGADGNINYERMAGDIAKGPHGHLAPLIQEQGSKVNESIAKAHKAQVDAEQAQNDLAGSIGAGMDEIVAKGGPLEEAAAYGIAHVAALRAKHLMSDDDALGLTKKLDPSNPEQLKRTIAAMRAASKEQASVQREQATATETGVDIETKRAALPGIPADVAKKQADAAVAAQIAKGTKGGLTPQVQAQMANQAGQLALSKQREAREASQAAARLALDKQREARAATAAKAGGAGGAKLSATAIEKVAGIDQSLGVIDSLDRLAKDEWLGPVAGRLTSASVSMPGLPVSDDLARFAAETATLKNAVVKAITGAQMSEPEAARIMKQVPDFNDKPNVWREKLKATRENISTLKRRTIELSGGSSPDAPVSATTKKTAQELIQQYGNGR